MVRLFAILLLAIFGWSGDAKAADKETAWHCLQRGGTVNYQQKLDGLPLCFNNVTFIGTCPANGTDLVSIWPQVISTLTNGPLNVPYIYPWEDQPISVVGMKLVRQSGPAVQLSVGATYSGDKVLYLMPDQTNAETSFWKNGGVIAFPANNAAPPATYFDLHVDNVCPPNQQIYAILTIAYIPGAWHLVDPPPPGTTTWSAVDKASSIILTNGNLSAAGSGGTFGSVRATQGYSTGKYHWENQVTAATGSTSVTGFGTNAMSLSSFVGNSAISIGIQASGSTSANGFSCVAAGVTWAAGDVQTFELDLDAHQIVLEKNGVKVNGGNPWCTWSGTLTLFPAWSSADAGDAGTAHFKASSFTTPVSTGFLPWDPN